MEDFKTIEECRLENIAIFKLMQKDLEELIHGKPDNELDKRRQKISHKLKSKAAADWFSERSARLDP